MKPTTTSLSEDPFFQSVQRCAQAARRSGVTAEQFKEAVNSLTMQKRRKAWSVVINHNPDRLPRWPWLDATPEGGRFGRICWLNSMPSEESWGRVWWSRR